MCKAENCSNETEGSRFYCKKHKGGVGVVNKTFKGKPIKPKTINTKPVNKMLKECKAENCSNETEGSRFYCKKHKGGVGVVNKTSKGNPIVSTRQCKAENCPNEALGNYHYCEEHRNNYTKSTSGYIQHYPQDHPKLPEGNKPGAGGINRTQQHEKNLSITTFTVDFEKEEAKEDWEDKTKIKWFKEENDINSFLIKGDFQRTNGETEYIPSIVLSKEDLEIRAILNAAKTAEEHNQKNILVNLYKKPKSIFDSYSLNEVNKYKKSFDDYMKKEYGNNIPERPKTDSLNIPDYIWLFILGNNPVEEKILKEIFYHNERTFKTEHKYLNNIVIENNEPFVILFDTKTNKMIEEWNISNLTRLNIVYNNDLSKKPGENK
jgi:hypothetical protein